MYVSYYGRIFAQQDAAVGAYSDTVTVTINFYGRTTTALAIPSPASHLPGTDRLITQRPGHRCFARRGRGASCVASR